MLSNTFAGRQYSLGEILKPPIYQIISTHEAILTTVTLSLLAGDAYVHAKPCPQLPRIAAEEAVPALFLPLQHMPLTTIFYLRFSIARS